MSNIGPSYGLDIVSRMQPRGSLEDAWLILDHVKRVQGWTTMACHVYDSKCKSILTIIVCDMQSEDTMFPMLHVILYD